MLDFNSKTALASDVFNAPSMQIPDVWIQLVNRIQQLTNDIHLVILGRLEFQFGYSAECRLATLQEHPGVFPGIDIVHCGVQSVDDRLVTRYQGFFAVYVVENRSRQVVMVSVAHALETEFPVK